MAQYGHLGNIIVHTVHISVSMVNNVVLLFPDKSIYAKAIGAKPHKVIHPFLSGIASVVGIVHHIKADSGYKSAQHDTFCECNIPDRGPDQ